MRSDTEIAFYLFVCFGLAYTFGIWFQIEIQVLLEDGWRVTPKLRAQQSMLLATVIVFSLLGIFGCRHIYQSDPSLFPNLGYAVIALILVGYLIGQKRGKTEMLKANAASHSSEDSEPVRLDAESPEDQSYRTSPVRYTMDQRGLRAFQRAKDAYNQALRHLPKPSSVKDSELAAIRNDPDLAEAVRLFTLAVSIETENARNLMTWEQIAYLSNAIRAHIWLAQVYIYCHEAEQCARHAQLANDQYNRLPMEVQKRNEGLGMKADILFRFAEADELRGVGPLDELISRYKAVLKLDAELGDRDGVAATKKRIDNLKRKL